MSKVLIDRELAERVCHVDNSTRQTARRELRTILATPSGTPAMPVKAYYHEAPNEYGGLNKAVGLEVRTAFIDAPLVLESDALARVACLEGEIAKRDETIARLEPQLNRAIQANYDLREELAACRIAVENCDLFRARIAELEADRDSHQRCAIQAMAELAALKAQEPVIDAPYGGILRIEAGNLPDSWVRINPCKLYASPAAPAADAGLVAVELAKDAEEWGPALNEAGWLFLSELNEDPQKSALIFNNGKGPLRAAIMKYAEIVAANAKDSSHD